MASLTKLCSFCVYLLNKQGNRLCFTSEYVSPATENSLVKTRPLTIQNERIKQQITDSNKKRTALFLLKKSPARVKKFIDVSHLSTYRKYGK